MSEQHLDLFSSSSALVILPSVLQISNRLTGFFVHVSCDCPVWSICASLFDQTGTTGLLICIVVLDTVIFLDATQWHLMPFKAGEAVAFGIILKMADVVFSMGLMFAIQYRHMTARCHMIHLPQSGRGGNHDAQHCAPSSSWPR